MFPKPVVSSFQSTTRVTPQVLNTPLSTLDDERVHDERVPVFDDERTHDERLKIHDERILSGAGLLLLQVQHPRHQFDHLVVPGFAALGNR